MWEPILRLPGITFVNVQYDQREDELLAVEKAFGIQIHRWADLDLKKDLEGAFALTKNLDMVISTSTSPSRIGDAAGAEFWLLMRSEESRDGKVCVSKCRSRRSPDHYKQKNKHLT